MVFTRVQVLDFPQAHPGKCCLCGSQTNNDGRKYVDFGLSVPQYGAIVFCSHCFREINEHLGWTSPEITANMKSIALEDRNAQKRLSEENERLRRALALLDFLPSIGVPDSSPVGAVPAVDAEQGPSDHKSLATAKRREAAKARVAKPANVRRSEDVQDPELAELLRSSI